MDFAHRWVEADTQNQLAWLTLASVHRARGEDDVAKAAFTRAAQASSWHESHLDIAHLLARQIPADASPAVREARLSNALGKANLWGLALDAGSTLGVYCKEGGDLRVACERIVATMARDTHSLMGLTLVPAFARRAQVDPLLVARYQMTADAAHWAIRLKMDEDADGSRSIARLQALLDVGERSCARDALREHRLTEAEAAARFYATLSPEQRARRTNANGP